MERVAVLIAMMSALTSCSDYGPSTKMYKINSMSSTPEKTNYVDNKTILDLPNFIIYTQDTGTRDHHIFYTTKNSYEQMNIGDIVDYSDNIYNHDFNNLIWTN